MASMNFLALVQRAYQEAGFPGNGPASVLNQSGRSRDVVNWVLAAHEEIQNMRTDWSFDWATFDFALTIGNDLYLATDMVAGGVREFLRDPQASYSYLTASGVSSRLFMGFMEWEQARGLIVPAAQGSQPTVFTMRPDDRIQYYPKPTAACTVHHEFRMPQQVLAVASDVPRMPANTHMALVWKAIMIGCGKTKDFSRFDTAEEEYTKLEHVLERDCTPNMQCVSGPLA